MGMRCFCLLLLPLVVLAAADRVTVEGTTLGGQPVLMVRGPASDPLPPAEAARMRQLVTLDLVEIPVAEACDHLARLTGAAIVVDPALRAEPDRIVTLQVQDMTADRALDWIRTIADVRVTALNGGLYVSLEEPQLATRTVIYRVGDLVHPVQDFPGPTLSVPEPGGEGSIPIPAPGGFGDEREQRLDVDELAEMVEELLAGE